MRGTCKTHLPSQVIIRIALPAMLTIVLFVTAIFFIILPALEESFLVRKREMIRELTESAWSVLATFESQERAGLMGREEAQAQVIAQIRNLRYGPERKDYFWINDMFPRMVMHPYRSDLDGKNISNFKDPRGKYLFVEFVNVVREYGAGYVDYMWQWKDDPGKIVPKLSYVKGFEPWGWIIGTGIYIEDVHAEVALLRRKLSAISMGILLFVSLLAFYIIRQTVLADRTRKRIWEERERLVEALSESERKLHTLMSNLPGMAYRYKDSTMEFVSEGCFKLTGYRPSDLEQSRTASYKDLIYPEYQEEVSNKVQSALKTRSPFRLEYRIGTADGTEKWVWEQGRGVFSPHEELLALEGFITDISERKLAEQALRESQAREREINIASKIQTTLLLGQPPRDIQGIRVAQLTIASQKVDGDFFDFIKLKSKCFDLVVGDVMGKGIAAALLGAAMKSHILRVLNEQIRISGKKDILPEPEDIISNVHSCMIDQLEDIETFVTLCYARFDLEKRLFSFVDCGHMRTIHFQDDLGSCELLQGVNMPLGFPEKESFSQISLPFRPGDFFFFYSDGLTESKNQDGFLYGEKRLVDFVLANAGLEPEDLIKSVWRDVVAFSQSEVFDDDFTCVLVKIGKESSKPILPSEAELEIKSDLKELRRVRGLFWEFCKSVPRSMLDKKSMFLLVKTALHVIKTLWSGIKIIVKKRKELKP